MNLDGRGRAAVTEERFTKVERPGARAITVLLSPLPAPQSVATSPCDPYDIDAMCDRALAQVAILPDWILAFLEKDEPALS